MTLSEFRTYVQSKIAEIKSMPAHGDVVDGYVFDVNDYLDYFAHIVRETYIRAAKYGYVAEPPKKLLSKSEALYYLKQVSAWLDGKQDDELSSKEFLSTPEIARLLSVGEETVIAYVNDPLDPLPATPVNRERNATKQRFRVHRDDLLKWFRRRATTHKRGR